MDRTHSGPQQSQSSLKKPAFNLSVFGTSSTVSVSQSSQSSTSTLNSSVLNSSQLGDSPFYPGKTTYGGAAAVRTARSRTATPYQVFLIEITSLFQERPGPTAAGGTTFQTKQLTYTNTTLNKTINTYSTTKNVYVMTKNSWPKNNYTFL
uniref:Nucleoporin Nup153 N-terminal domain-containing protein n=1 Tax=Hucho hucho TaxID=62062 RepID=A0A4W5KST9_9TELE